MQPIDAINSDESCIVLPNDEFFNDLCRIFWDKQIVFLNLTFYEDPIDKRGIIKAMSAAFRLYYYGLNWDQLEEYIRDDDEVPEHGCFLYYPSALLLKKHSPYDYGIFIDIINHTHEYWKERNRFFKLGYYPEERMERYIKEIEHLRR